MSHASLQLGLAPEGDCKLIHAATMDIVRTHMHALAASYAARRRPYPLGACDGAATAKGISSEGCAYNLDLLWTRSHPRPVLSIRDRLVPVPGLCHNAIQAAARRNHPLRKS